MINHNICACGKSKTYSIESTSIHMVAECRTHGRVDAGTHEQDIDRSSLRALAFSLLSRTSRNTSSFSRNHPHLWFLIPSSFPGRFKYLPDQSVISKKIDQTDMPNPHYFEGGDRNLEEIFCDVAQQSGEKAIPWPYSRQYTFFLQVGGG